MADAPKQPSSSDEGGSSDTGSSDGKSQSGDQGTTGSQVDLKSLKAEQLADVLENPNFWELSRVKQLQEASTKLKKYEEDAQKQTEAELKEQNKFKELSDKQSETIAKQTSEIQNLKMNQALTNKLSPLGVVDIEAALQLIDRSEIKVDDNGQVSGIDKAIEALKSSKAYLFNEGDGKSTTVGSPTNPGNGGTSTGPATFKRSQLKDPGPRVTESTLRITPTHILTIETDRQYNALIRDAIAKYPELGAQKAIPKFAQDLGYQAIEGTKAYDPLAGIAIFDRNLLK